MFTSQKNNMSNVFCNICNTVFVTQISAFTYLYHFDHIPDTNLMRSIFLDYFFFHVSKQERLAQMNMKCIPETQTVKTNSLNMSQEGKYNIFLWRFISNRIQESFIRPVLELVLSQQKAWMWFTIPQSVSVQSTLFTMFSPVL